jgi:hypothetical protein
MPSYYAKLLMSNARRMKAQQLNDAKGVHWPWMLQAQVLELFKRYEERSQFSYGGNRAKRSQLSYGGNCE